MRLRLSLSLPLPLPLRRFVVQDTSMRPALQPADRVLIWQWQWPWRWARPVRGDVVVLRDPERPRTFAVKRVAAIQPTGAVVVRGDNPNVSRDSRTYGPVPAHLILGRVIYRYLPRERRGRLAAPR